MDKKSWHKKEVGAKYGIKRNNRGKKKSKKKKADFYMDI